MTNLNGKTPDITAENVRKIKLLFPEVFSEGKIDFDKLKQVLGEYVDESKERYNFSWNGKGKALRLSQTPSMGTLRPCKGESKDWDTTQNLYIEGDNLEVLKLLQKTYHNKIKMIYIDPPYNTGKDFVYPDNFTNSIGNYKQITGQVDSEGNSISTNTEASGRYHTDWLNMMYARLRLARNLLANEGVIFISIGQDELSNLQKLCNETFGEANCLGIVSRQMKSGGGSQGKYFAHNIDYVVIYAKEYDVARYFRGEMSEDLVKNVYNQIETEGARKGEYYRSMGLYQSSLGVRPSLRYFIKCPDGSFVIPKGTTFPINVVEGEKITPISTDGVWRWSYEKYVDEFAKGNIEFKESKQEILVDEKGKPSKWNIYTKIWLNDRQDEGTIPNDLITKYENRHSSKEISALNIPFDFAKPVGLIKYLISIMQQDNDIFILDFFSGSATTAHAVMQTNAEDGGNRKFIMVQLPEETDEKDEAYKAGYMNICEIGKERIRRAGDKIKEDAGLMVDKLDIGFKVFKLDSSNLKKWNPDYNNLEASLIDVISNYVDNRTEEDVVYEIMLKMGLDLTYPVGETKLEGKKVYSIGLGALMVCLDDDITTDVAKGMVAIKNEMQPETWKVVFKDNGFANDSAKTNVKEILKCAGLEEDAFTTV